MVDTVRRSTSSIAPDAASSYDAVRLAELTTKARKSLKTSQFAVPSKRSKSGGSGGYPIPDEAHARNALARVAQFGTPAEKAQVRAAVKAKFPNIGKSKSKNLTDMGTMPMNGKKMPMSSKAAAKKSPMKKGGK